MHGTAAGVRGLTPPGSARSHSAAGKLSRGSRGSSPPRYIASALSLRRSLSVPVELLPGHASGAQGAAAAGTAAGAAASMMDDSLARLHSSLVFNEDMSWLCEEYLSGERDDEDPLLTLPEADSSGARALL